MDDLPWEGTGFCIVMETLGDQEIVQGHLKGGEPVERLRFSVPD